MSAFFYLFRNKWVPPADPHASFEGKTVIVTGANTGLGLEAAIKFATSGASRLIITSRDLKKGAAAKDIIRQRLAATSKTCLVEVWQLDLNDYSSIEAFGKRADAELETLDIAVLNAGVHNAKFEQSRYGWEGTMQVNTLSTTLLALTLLPKLKQSTKLTGKTATLEFVSSGLHYRTKLNEAQKSGDVDLLDSFNHSENFSAQKQYGASKLFLMYAVKELAAKAAHESGLEVFVTSVCPGMCQSDIARDYDSLLFRIGKSILNVLFMRTAEQGSRTFVSGALLGGEGHGQFWQHDVIKE